MDNQISELFRILPQDITNEILTISKGMNDVNYLTDIELDLNKPIRCYYRDDKGVRPVAIKELDILVNWLHLKDIYDKSETVSPRTLRTGINGTLHRVSFIQGRDGDSFIGATIRVGRDVPDTEAGLTHLLDQGKSILIIGMPGSGKTTKLRGISRYLSEDLTRRVIIIDRSDEIAGVGDLPLSAVGASRVMPLSPNFTVEDTILQAIQNHSPEVLVLDEIGNKDEVEVIRSCAKRGVQLIATVHGRDISEILQNPVLSKLLGGVNIVTLSDETAIDSGRPKTSPERESEPIFDAAVVLYDFGQMDILEDVKDGVDKALYFSKKVEVKRTLRPRF